MANVDPAHGERSTVATSGRWRRGWSAPALVFFTSAAVLVLEILAGRLLAPYVGVSLETYTGVIGTVLGGIALGNTVGGRVADRRDPRPLLGPLLVAAGVASVATLPLITALGPGVAAAGGGPGGVVLLAVAAFVVPTALLSAVPPIVAKLRLASTSETGTVVGDLAAAGTAGALVGTFATGFVFIAAWPTRPIVVGVGVALAVTGLAVSLRAGRRPRARVLGLLLLAPLLAQVAASPCEWETRYYCAAVVVDPDRSSGRMLVLDDLRHSYVDLDDATHLRFRYTRLFAAVAAAAHTAGPIDALHLGGGGFTFPRWLAATRPGSASTVLELDPEIVGIARRELGLRTGPDLRVRVGDARRNVVDERADSYDLAVGDAFAGRSVPWHLATVEMLDEVDRVLRPDGVYVLNVIDGEQRRLVRAMVATLATVFDHVTVVTPPEPNARNYVLVAAHRPVRLDVPAVEGVVLTGPEVERFAGDAKPLRDDYAPADQLLTR